MVPYKFYIQSMQSIAVGEKHKDLNTIQLYLDLVTYRGDIFWLVPKTPISGHLGTI